MDPNNIKTQGITNGVQIAEDILWITEEYINTIENKQSELLTVHQKALDFQISGCQGWWFSHEVHF